MTCTIFEVVISRAPPLNQLSNDHRTATTATARTGTASHHQRRDVVARSAVTPPGVLTAVGVAALISFHVFVNVGMTIRVMPVTGLPLPFMSAGGTVFVAMSVGLGLARLGPDLVCPLDGTRYRESSDGTLGAIGG